MYQLYVLQKQEKQKLTKETRSSRFEQLYRWTCARSLKYSLNIAICIIVFVRKYFTYVQLLMHYFINTQDQML